jgi:hypothetical protein
MLYRVVSQRTLKMCSQKSEKDQTRANRISLLFVRGITRERVEIKVSEVFDKKLQQQFIFIANDIYYA